LIAEHGHAIDKPLVVRLDGNNADLGRKILTDANLSVVILEDTMDGAARRAAQLAAK
jgi:succinyl-CoA synthetase beta subunit